MLWPIIGRIFPIIIIVYYAKAAENIKHTIDRGVPQFNAPAGGDPLRISG